MPDTDPAFGIRIFTDDAVRMAFEVLQVDRFETGRAPKMRLLWLDGRYVTHTAQTEFLRFREGWRACEAIIAIAGIAPASILEDGWERHVEGICSRDPAATEAP